MDNYYWTTEQEEGVREYLRLGPGTPDANRIFEEILYRPLYEMVAEVLIKHRLYVNGEENRTMICEVLGHILIKFNRYDPSKGTKAYSFFRAVAKNYLVDTLRRRARDEKLLITVDYL